MINGGYTMIDCKGLKLTETNPQNIPGSWKAVQDAIATNKPIVAYNCVYATAPVSPVTCFGWALSATEIVIVGATLHIHVKSDNTATVIDVAA